MDDRLWATRLVSPDVPDAPDALDALVEMMALFLIPEILA
jgi:hypothetical protein